MHKKEEDLEKGLFECIVRLCLLDIVLNYGKHIVKTISKTVNFII